VNPMNGLDLVMLAHDTRPERAVAWLILYGPVLPAVVGLVLSFFRQHKWLALAMVAVANGLFLTYTLLDGPMVALKAIFLHWDGAAAIAFKTPPILGVMTIASVYGLYRKEKRQRN